MKLKDKNWAVAVEKAIGWLLRAFACDNWADAKLLQQLMMKAGFTQSNRPRVIVSKYGKETFCRKCVSNRAYYSELQNVHLQYIRRK